MLLFPEPLDGLTVSQEAEEEIVQFPLAKTEMNWLPASPSTLWVLMAIDGGSTGSSLTGSLHEYTTADSARSTVSTWNKLVYLMLTVFGQKNNLLSKCYLNLLQTPVAAASRTGQFYRFGRSGPSGS